uniref:Lipopolysaccharide biosynthesis protein n=1 Tax=Erysipelothrix rhusiopathiae TaxID=1648 RepID=A0A5A4PWE1_ERYRH|nr:hypothetical protein [Erysipelothrix rhusiopathiae]
MKKIVVIAPKFFGIHDSIVNAFEAKGYQTYFYDERMNSTKLNKIILRKFPGLVQKKIKRYYDQILEEIKVIEPDGLFVIKCENIPVDFIKSVKTELPETTRIHYMFDPVDNCKNILNKMEHFDYKLTFDKKDSIRYGWEFRPLFFPESLSKIVKDKNYLNLACFVGTLHTDRSMVIENITNELAEKSSGSILIYYYIPLKSMFFLGKYVKKIYRNLKFKDVTTKPMSQNETNYQLVNSKHIIDVHHVKQTGLTLRTIESIGARSKLITTNPSIRDYDFYNENNILIVDRDNPIIPLEWLQLEYQDISSEIYDYYSISGFVNTFINLL